MLHKLPSLLQQQIEAGISTLGRGGVVAFPTDTVYGLGAAADIPQAIEKIYQVKQRAHDKALPLLLEDISQISEVACRVSETAWLLARTFLPGALTLVLPKSDSVLDIISGGGQTVAVRVPAHAIPVALVNGLGMPIVGTSANISGHPSPLTADEVRDQFGDKIDLIIDGGRCPGGKESTVVDVTGEVPLILREGAIPRKALEEVCQVI
ncbi:MAG: threonylcarbamoyl-AMP synthase [Chloroflexi bacterium]|nr:threonylcarbamoyl-AMP synthase [Chloroflexota bacterium]